MFHYFFVCVCVLEDKLEETEKLMSGALSCPQLIHFSGNILGRDRPAQRDRFSALGPQLQQAKQPQMLLERQRETVTVELSERPRSNSTVIVPCIILVVNKYIRIYTE